LRHFRFVLKRRSTKNAFIRANRDTVALIEDGARFSDFLVDWAATPIRFWWNSFARKVLEHACATEGSYIQWHSICESFARKVVAITLL
jgi:hypothetical protein